MPKQIVISLYDYTGEAVKPWAEAGFDCYCFDIQHNGRTSERYGRGRITYVEADLYDHNVLTVIALSTIGQRVAMVLGFPPCTDLAVSGAAHFKKKREADPGFQTFAVENAKACAVLANKVSAPYMIENPVSVLSTQWRKPDYTFHPHQYGGYIPEGQEKHPTWPVYIAASDAYPKKTCLWTGNGFVMPEPKPVDVPKGYSTQHKKLGGKSMKTKNIRSATPRGFARAVFFANTKEG